MGVIIHWVHEASLRKGVARYLSYGLGAGLCLCLWDSLAAFGVVRKGVGVIGWVLGSACLCPHNALCALGTVEHVCYQLHELLHLHLQ